MAALSFAVNYAISGTDTWSYHLFNILIHAAVAVMLCNLILLGLSEERFKGRFAPTGPWLALLSAMLWCVHPLTTQAVTYISQRLESQAALFLLICVYCALKGQKAPRRMPWFLLSLAAYCLGAGTKESVGLAPALILAYEYVLRGKRPLAALKQSKMLYGGLAACMVLLALHIMYGGQLDAGVNVTRIPFCSYVFTQGEVIVHYLRLVFWPSPLVLDYAWSEASLMQGLLPFLLVLCLAGATLYWTLRRRAWSFPLFWMLATLAPTCFAPMVDPAVEYRMYLPLMGGMFLVVLGVFLVIQRVKERMDKSWWLPGAGAVLGVLGVLSLGVVSIARNADYSDNLRIWQDTINKRPGNPRGYLNYGVTLYNRGLYGESFDYFLRSIEIEPQSTEAYFYAGISMLKQGHPKDALPFLQQAKETDKVERRAKVHEFMAQAYEQTGSYGAAADELRKVIAMSPESGRLEYLLGKVLLKKGDKGQALHHFCRAGEVSGNWQQVAPYLEQLATAYKAPCAGEGQ